MYIIKEGFQAGTANKVIQKIISVVQRKTGQQISVADLPFTYVNQYGKFSGFYCKSNLIDFRLNFLLGSSDSLYSMDLFGSSATPKITVDLYQFNIVQCIEAISDELQNGLYMPIKEASDRKEYVTSERKKMLFNEWLKEEPNALELLQNKKLPEVYVAFLKKDQEYNKEVNLASFVQLAKEHLFSLGLTNPTFRPRKKGSVEKEVVDKALEDKFLDIVDSMGWQDKFEFLKGTIKQMYKGTINSIFVYGNPGTGKSFDVINTLNNLNAEYKLYKGNVIKGTDDLFRLIYNNRGDEKNNKILVFDDGDKAIQNTDINIWKTILENVKEREITYVDVKRNKNRNMSDIPPVFSFYSSVIFISNSPKLNSAIASRSVVLNMKLSNEETLNKVESTLKEFLPDIDIKIKREAIEYAREISNGIKNVDYRSVEKIIIARQINPKDWKKYSLWMLSS